MKLESMCIRERERGAHLVFIEGLYTIPGVSSMNIFGLSEIFSQCKCIYYWLHSNINLLRSFPILPSLYQGLPLLVWPSLKLN